MNLDVDPYEELHREIYQELEEEYQCNPKSCISWNYGAEDVNCSRCRERREKELNAAVDKRIKDVLEGKDLL